MTQTISYSTFDYESVYCVSVIASFDSEGHIRPLYVRICGEPYKVQSYWVKNSFCGITEFNCKLLHDDRLIPVLLAYHQKEGIWTVPRK